MAEIKSSPSAAKVDEGAKKDVQTRPVKPDEAAFKAKLAQAEKDHKQSQEKAVSKKSTLFLLAHRHAALHCSFPSI